MERKARSHTVSGLRAKRAELLVHLRRLDSEREQVVAALLCLDGAIDLFVSPSIDTGRYAPVEVGTQRMFNRFVGDFLRASNGPVSLGTIAKAWLDHLGEESTKESRNNARVRIRNKFDTLVRVGVLEEVLTSSAYKHWQLIR